MENELNDDERYFLSCLEKLTMEEKQQVISCLKSTLADRPVTSVLPASILETDPSSPG